MSKIIVLAGSTSDEREVSLRSGAAVAKALEKAGHQVETLDPANGLDKLLPDLQRADVIFPALHGKDGEDGKLQEFLESHDVRCIGCDSQSSALCFDKLRYTQLMGRHSVPMPTTKLMSLEEFEASPEAQEPFVLKPNDSGSGIDVFVVRDPRQADKPAIQRAFRRYKKMLLQQLIDGVEISVGVLGKEPLPVIEIIPPEGGEFDYENKYNGQTQELCPPVHVNRELQQQAQVLAKKAHELTGCRDFSRTDIMISPAGKLYVLETNTIPGMTGESLYPKEAREAGYEMSALCDKLVQLALQH